MTIKSLMVFVIVSGIALFGIMKHIKQRNESILENRYFNNYIIEYLKLFHNMTHIAGSVPDGVDSTLWMKAAYMIAEEPEAHPLREDGRNRSYISELADKQVALSQINNYIDNQIKNSQTEVETLSSLRERILRDYDPKRRTTRDSLSPDHAQGCSKKFNMLIHMIIKSRWGFEERKMDRRK